MTDENTQNKNNFRGIQDLALLCFDGEPGIADDKKSTATKVIYLSSGNNAYSKDAYRALYRDIEIPTGTTNFIMNGRAIRNGETDFAIGKITPSDTDGKVTELSKLTYSLNPINSEADFAENEKAKKIIEALNYVRNASAKYSLSEKEQADFSNESEVKVNWKDAWNKDVKWPSSIQENERNFLAQRYIQFVNLTAGSASSVRATLENLKQILIGEVNNNTDNTTISAEKAIQKAIYDACTKALGTDYLSGNNFPQETTNKELPDGVAKLKWIKNTVEGSNAPDSVFAYVASDAVKIGDNRIDYTKITYPAEISYTVSTPGMVSNSDFTNVSNLPDYQKWIKNTEGIWDKSIWSEGAVTTRTKSVALKLPVQYSVACLKTTVKCGSSTLEDNGANYGLKETQKITVPSDGFQLTGILVGGQPAKVNWDFYPSATEQFEYTVYDRDIQKTENKDYNSVTTSDGTANYTLLLDNKVSASATVTGQKNVYVTLELKNGTQSFYGADGLVPANGTFYLVGTLDLSQKTASTIDRIFLQDHTTVVNFTITNLKKAYNCIPDLRTAGMNVGLAVDLEWQTGLTFDVEL